MAKPRTKETIQGWIKLLQETSIDKINFISTEGKTFFNTTNDETITEVVDALTKYYTREIEYAPTQEEYDYKNGGADVMLDGSLCKSEAFTSRAGYKCSDEERERIKKLPVIKYQDIKDIDDPDAHRWYSIWLGNDYKYGRYMYDPKTDTLRKQTMGEFYETSTVD